MPPPLAVIWRTWPQILSPLAIWAVLSRLQGGFSFRLIPPSSPVACQVRLPQSGFPIGDIYLFRTSPKRFLVEFYGHIVTVVHVLWSHCYRRARFVVTLLPSCTFCCHIITAAYIYT